MNTSTNAYTDLETPATTSATTVVRSERQRWTAKEKSEYLTLFAESDLTAAEFCREMGLSEATFSLWRRQQQIQEKPEIARVIMSGDVNDSADSSFDGEYTGVAETSVYIKMPNGIETRILGLDATAISKLLTSLAR